MEIIWHFCMGCHIFHFADIFCKKAQQLPENLDAQEGLSDEENQAFRDHVIRINKESKVVSDWVDDQLRLGSTFSDGRDFSVPNTYSDAMQNSAMTLNQQSEAYFQSNNTDKTISVLDSDFQNIKQNYNNLKTNYLKQDWINNNPGYDVTDAMKNIGESINYVEQYIQKRKNLEAALDNEEAPPLP